MYHHIWLSLQDFASLFIIVSTYFLFLNQLEVYLFLEKSPFYFCFKFKVFFPLRSCRCNPIQLFLLNPSPLLFKQVICVHDVSSIYRVPLLLEEQGVVDYFLRRLDLPIERQSRKMLMKWKEMADRFVINCCVCVPQSFVQALFTIVRKEHRGGGPGQAGTRTPSSEFRLQRVCCTLSHQLNSSLVAERHMYSQSLQECQPWLLYS